MPIQRPRARTQEWPLSWEQSPVNSWGNRGSHRTAAGWILSTATGICMWCFFSWAFRWKHSKQAPWFQPCQSRGPMRMGWTPGPWKLWDGKQMSVRVAVLLICRKQVRKRSTGLKKLHLMYYFCCGFFAKWCPTLCDPMDCSPPGSSVPRISQARILEWVAISFSRGPSRPRGQTRISCTDRRALYLCATWEPCTVVNLFYQSSD